MILEVPPDLEGERLDKALAAMLDVSRSVAKELVAMGVTIEARPAQANTRVVAGDVVETPPPPSRTELQPEPLDFEVLYEDPHVVVVNKRPGLVVHPGAGSDDATLAAGLLFRFPEIEGVGSKGRWGLIHRLDKDTSGALIVALDQPGFEKLSAALRAREITREYVALVEGQLRPPTGTIDAPIGRDRIRPIRRAVIPDGKQARTHYQVVRNYPGVDVSLVDVQLESGRTHQIRVHFAAIGHAVVGDPIYGKGMHRVASPRVFLHAGKVAFPHPVTDTEVVVSAPLPDDLSEVLTHLNGDDHQ